MKRGLVLIWLFTCSVFLGVSQTPQRVFVVDKLTSASTDSRIEVLPNKDTVLISKFVYQDPKTFSRQYIEKTYLGTPFLKNKWDRGILYFKDGSTVNGLLAYNLVNNLVYYSIGEVKDAIEAKPSGFTIGGVTFMKLDKGFENAFSGYFETIFVDTRLSLYKQYSCIYRPKITGDRLGYEPEGGVYEGAFDKSFSFFLGQNNNLAELKSNANIYRQFGEYRKAAEFYVKQNNLNLKKEQDLIQLIVYYASLLNKFEKQ